LSTESSGDESEEIQHQHQTSAGSASKTKPAKAIKAANSAEMSANKADIAKLSKVAISDSAFDDPLANTRCASVMEVWELRSGVIQDNRSESDGGKCGTDGMYLASLIASELD
jgi:hypothetical protein